MAEMLLINPRKRRATRKTHTVARRRHNPMTAVHHKRRTRRKHNPMTLRSRVMHHTRRRTRRHNPIMSGMGGNYMSMIREAFMGGAGAVGMDLLFGQINKYLPASMQRTAGSVGAGDAVKAILTVVIGNTLNKATRGFSKKAAMSSLTVQAYEIMKHFVPSTMALGYASPAMITQGTNRVGPIRQNAMSAYTASGTPLLSAYQRSGGATALLSGASTTSRREGVSMYY